MNEQEVLRQLIDTEAYRDNPLEAFRADMDRIRPRFMDIYVLPAFMLWFAYSSKTPMGRWPRLILFTGGMYMMYRNAKKYREALRGIAASEESLPGKKLLPTPTDGEGPFMPRVTPDALPKRFFPEVSSKGEGPFMPRVTPDALPKRFFPEVSSKAALD